MARAPDATRPSIVVAAAVAMLSLASAAVADPHVPAVTADPGVVLSWNAIAFRTISVEGKQPPPVAELYLGLVSTAVYNAVVTSEGEGRATLRQPQVHGDASPDVAAATAAHDALASFFPASRAALDADYQTWLAHVPESDARTRGQQVGRDAARAMISSRDGDGRNAQVPVPPPGPPSPGAYSGDFIAPWLGFVEPVLIASPTKYATDGPDELTSSQYAADVDEVRRMGAAVGSDRTPEQTDLALFFSDNPVQQYQDAMRERAARKRMDILDSARMFAAADAAGADALVTCWRTKYDHYFWRPVQAIHQADLDGNPATVADPNWAPLLKTPPYPEYASGHACVSEATARALEDLFGAGRVDLTIRSGVAGLSTTSRHYTSERAWLGDVTDARIWLGIHFRHAMDDGRQIGREVADAVVKKWFRSSH